MQMMDLDDGSPAAPVRPPTFAECYVCHKQFGSRSIALHEPKCLEKWRAANGALPAGRRAATPVRLEALPVRRAPPQPAASVASLTASWPSSNGLLKAALAAGPAAGAPGRLSTPGGGRAARPQTTTLSRPKVLAAEHAAQVDMSAHRCSELLALTSLSGAERPAGSSSGSSSTSSSSSSSKSSSSSGASSSSSPVSDDVSESSSSRAARPGTMRLAVGPRELHVPNIEQRARTAVLSPGRSSSHSRSPPAVPRYRDGMPSPCVTCGKTENPERFHSHPEEGQREPARAAPRRFFRRRHSIQKPVPVRFHAQPSLDPAAKRKQQQRDKKRAQQRQQQEDEAQQRLREEEQQRHLAETLARYGRPAAGPTFVVCYVCGRQFGANSLPIHQPQCLERWFKSNTALPRRKRGPAPQPPDHLPEGTPIDEYNRLATLEAQRVSGEQQEQNQKRTPVPSTTPTPPVSKADESLFFIEF
ncbi:zinc finger protein 474-like [Amphibalanus amphitrite]|uniref:zinc finger protein 474-like n=1 Tax=Amphibalanus amphitrite TaxID=1232801 RepID=UPI001C9072E9|nr:zinc finger protein 474-like [Amphibalanus amphitrite]